MADTKDGERYHKCSSITSCYDFGAHKYSNDKCGADESCGTWRKKGDVLLQGCIKSQYCAATGMYEGHATTFKCPQGAKAAIPAGVSDVPQQAGGDTPAAAPGARTPLFDVMGYTDLDIVDGLAGLLGGIMKTDEKAHFANCYGGVPQIIEQFEAEF